MEDKFLKLTSTVYKVLEFFPESDPLKSRAKDKALAIMDNLVLVSENQRMPAVRQGWVHIGEVFSEEKIKAKLSEDIDILLGYFWIAKTQGWLSASNCLILSNEYEKIKKSIEPVIEFATPKIDEPFIVKDNNNGLKLLEKKEETKAENLEKSKIKDAGIKTASATDDIKIAELSDRQKKILDFLNKNQKAQVMDLIGIIPNITKRTIRRDLDGLLESGKVKRLGAFNQVFYEIA